MAKLKYTFDDYINNPSGKGSAVHGFINTEQFEKELMSLESKNAKVTYTVYRVSSIGGKVSYYIHFLIYHLYHYKKNLFPVSEGKYGHRQYTLLRTLAHSTVTDLRCLRLPEYMM